MRANIITIITKLFQPRNLYTRALNVLKENKYAAVLIAMAALIRLSNFYSHVTFLGDQGRDAIIIKNIATLQHFTLIGAPTSVGAVFMGPFYYYLVAPFLWLTWFDPVGLALGVAILWLIGLGATYAIVKHYTDNTTAFLYLFIAAFSSRMIEFARSSWNPNLLPVFGFLTLAFFYWGYMPKEHQKKKDAKLINKPLIYAGIAGLLFGAGLQFHFLAALMAPALAIMFVVFLIISKDKKPLLLNLFASAFGCFLSLSPLLLFDIRHGFINSKQFISLFKGDEVVTDGSYYGRLLETSSAFFNHVFRIELKPELTLLIFVIIAILILFYSLRKKNYFVLLQTLNFILFIFGFALLTSYRHVHYYGSSYLSFFLVLALMFTAWKKYFMYLLAVLFIVWYSYAQSIHFSTVFKQGGRQIERAKMVAHTLEKRIGNKPYNIATWPIVESEDPYVYFLDLWGHPAANRHAVEITEQMYVLCFKKPCRVLNSPSWNISMFGPAKIVETWNIDGIKIYKLVHKKQ